MITVNWNAVINHAISSIIGALAGGVVTYLLF